MPPLRSSRASKACDLCRKYKTRCYASDSAKGSCLRCQTLSQPCSLRLESTTTNHHQESPNEHQQDDYFPENDRSDPSEFNQHQNKGDERLTRLERIVENLADRLDSRIDALASAWSNDSSRPRATDPMVSIDRDTAPMFMIRDAATDAGVHSPEAINPLIPSSDVISTGLISLSTAHSLVELFHIHYGRWVKFPDGISTEALLQRIRKSPLLICSVFLIAIRHTTQNLAERLAPHLFHEAKRLVTESLLIAPQPLEFFQAVLILSLWSTTIGQAPLSIDSWLLTGYALQQAVVSPDFANVFFPSTDIPQLDNWCLWNHLCLAHLQYCVGTCRQAMLSKQQIDCCSRLAKSGHANNYEERMVAEVNLYWIIYEKCCASQIDLAATKLALQSWQHEWTILFDQPRSQFLQMGFYFAHLLAYGQSLKSVSEARNTPIIETAILEMVQCSRSIINIAIETTDDRTRHLTDQIYNIVTFSALTLCRLVHTYEQKLRAASYDIEALDELVVKIIEWLRSIGLPCHAANMLASIVSAQFDKLRPYYRPTIVDTTALTSHPVLSHESPPRESELQYSDFIGSELFATVVDNVLWPQWGPFHSGSDETI